MNINYFKKISLNGRVSYGISCFENTLIALNYNVNEWRIVLEYLWEFTSIKYLDDWGGIVAEIIPENLLEFKSYEEHHFEYLDEKNFKYLHRLYQNIDKKIDFVMTSIYDIGISHAYSRIVEYGQNSLDELEILINHMVKSNVPLPDINPFERFSIEENNGWGNAFDGKSISSIL
ncbi:MULTISPECIES: hypothetical protein [unclassified Lysinibacillus]|uniref:hypothetical protein n=1 Tax=unclassified Lysinibacillus TaxID=2636778 RepID=UPI00255448E6|nr:MULTISPECIES: hypothetical protein [unclassified Lysinibacillus]MDM5249115.1 hypothetical protein [Lysinibacillus sp. G4S2]